MRLPNLTLFLLLGPVFWPVALTSQAPDPPSEAFAAWLAELGAEARLSGISDATIEAALADVAPIGRVIELDRNQPEVQMDFWTYLDRVASDARIDQGKRLLGEHRSLLADIEARHGIPASMLVAVWGIESSFGSNLGGFPVIGSLVTLAYDQRRPALFRRELIHALRIVDDGHIGLAEMQGSWAGAMGQVQFMPSTFNQYARDGNGDGRRDIWQTAADALESAAAFMSSSWRRGYIWGRQVRLPAEFDRDLAGLETQKALDEWQALGVRRIDGTALPGVDIQGSIVLPTLGTEPAFLVYQNYRALLAWNRSNLFALSVGHLADRIAGQGGLQR
jgi:membrane-bound lytic murein transglycosylase B